MNKTMKMKKNSIITALCLLSCLAVTNVMAQAADHSFNYQGELLDAGTPANGEYDILVQMVDGQGTDVGTASVHENTQVDNGLFNIDVEIGGIGYFDGFEDYYFEISIRPGASGGSFTVVSPVQALQAVPLATNLVNGTATSGQVLTFNGFQWNPQTPVGSNSLWTENGSDVFYTAGRVGIGRSNPAAQLHVASVESIPAIFDGGDSMYTLYAESGQNRGYIGSYQNPATPGINDEDFEIGTYANTGGSFHITTGSNEPRITVNAGGDVGIGTNNPAADLMIDGDDQGDVFRVRVNSSTKLYVDGNGGTAIGSLTAPPINGLSVSGDIRANSKITAPDSGVADMKAYVYGFANSTGAVLTSLSTAGFAVSKTSTGLYKIDFTDTSINQNYMVVASTNSSSPKFTSVVVGTDGFDLHVWDTSGNHTDHAFQFVVYRK